MGASDDEGKRPPQGRQAGQGSGKQERDLFEVAAEVSGGERLFLQLGERLREVFWITDAVTEKVLYLSPGFTDVWGLPRALIFSDVWNFLKYVHPDDRPQASKLGSREHYTEEFRIYRADGTLRWLRARSTTLKDRDGNPFRTVGIAEDITERKEAEAASRQNEALLSSLVDAMPDLLLLFGPDNAVTHFRGDASLLLTTPDRVLGLKPPESVAGEIAGKILQCLTDVRAGVKVPRCEYKARNMDGDMRYYEGRFAPCGEGHVLGIVRDISERKRMQKRLRQSRRRHEEMRRQFISQIIAAQEDERRRIARELHDTMAQSLTSLLVGLRALADKVDDTEALDTLQSLRQLTASTIEEAQRLARGLRPSVLDDLGFVPAMERLVADAEHAHGFRVDLHMSGFAGQLRLTPTMETALYRILQEGLTNVGRHADATNVDLLIERSPTYIRAIVEDNGKGFTRPPPSSAARSGLGLLGIHERAALLHGQALVDSSPGLGTTITITLPLEPDAV